MSEEDVEFAIGFGEGIGRVYNHLEDSQKQLVMSYVNDGDAGFSRGLGIGFGSVFSYFQEDIKQDILVHLPHNKQLSLGLGIGAGIHISYLSEATDFKILEVARSNSFLAFGFGEGCGIVFPYLSEDTKSRISTQVNMNGFAFGFGIGIGKIRHYLENGTFKEALAFTNRVEFMKGFGIGLGTIAAKLSKDLLDEILSITTAEGSFSRNFGFGIGHIFSSLDEDKRKGILQIMKHSEEHFLVGLGEGLGHSLPPSGSRLVEEVMHAIGSADLERGVARGVAESFVYLNLAEVLGMLEYAGSNPEYGMILGKGLADKFASLDEEKQSWIVDALQKDSHFSRMFSKTIQKNLDYVSSQARERIKDMETKFPHLAIALEKEETVSD